MLDIIYKQPFTESLKQNNNNRPLMFELKKIINWLAKNEELPKKYKLNCLNKNSKGIKEIQLNYDNLFLYFSISENNILTLIDINSHAKLFAEKY